MNFEDSRAPSNGVWLTVNSCEFRIEKQRVKKEITYRVDLMGPAKCNMCRCSLMLTLLNAALAIRFS